MVRSVASGVTGSADLAEMKCRPCQGGQESLKPEQAQQLLKQVSSWELKDNLSISKTFTFKNFREAQRWLDRMADLAEEQGHHPDVSWRYNRVTIELTTHAIVGLSDNDFIMAAKLDRL